MMPPERCVCGYNLKRRNDFDRIECVSCKQLWFDFEETYGQVSNA